MDNNGNGNNFSGKSWEEISREIEQRGERAISGEKGYEPVEVGNKPNLPNDTERLPIQPKKVKKKASVKQMPVREAEKTEENQPQLKITYTNPKKAAKNKKRQAANLSNDEERKEAANEKKKRKVKSRIKNSVIAVIIAMIIGVALLMFFAFKTAEIKVDGESKYDSKDIIAACGINIGDYVWMINRAEVNSVICKLSPYIGEVTVDVKLPSTVILTLIPAVEKYAIPYAKNYIIVSDRGKVLNRTEKSIPKGVVELKGVSVADAIVGELITYADGEHQKIEIADKLLECAAKCEIEPVNSITIENSTAIYMQYDKRIKVYFGNSTDLESKMTGFKGMVEILSKENKNSTGVANLSVAEKAFFLPGSMDAEITAAKKYEIQTSSKKKQ